MSSALTDEKQSLSSTAITTNSGSRFGAKSHNMFFSRNAAHPRRLRFITGVGGVQICSMKDDQYVPPATPNIASSLISDPRFTITFPPNSYNESLLKSYSSKLTPKKNKERFLPPIRFWTNSGLIVDDTSKWREELETLASSVGLMTTNELKDATDKIQREKTSFPSSPSKRNKTASEQKPLTSNYSKETGRLNETPKTGRTPKSRRSSSLSKMPDYLFCIDNSERELWMIQVLCQILQTESMHDVQSWLVSAGQQEKDAARELIEKALQGLNESGRIQVENPSNNKNNVQTQVDLEQIKETIKKINETQQNERAQLFTKPVIKPIVEEEDNDESDYVAVAKSEIIQLKHDNDNQHKNPVTPIQKILSASVNYQNRNSQEPVTLINDTKYIPFKPKDDIQKRPFTADVFKTKKDSRVDKRLSNKIIKELMSFVEVERKEKQPNNSLQAIETLADSNTALKTPNPQTKDDAQNDESTKQAKPKLKLSKNSQKDSQVLVIED